MKPGKALSKKQGLSYLVQRSACVLWFALLFSRRLNEEDNVSKEEDA